MEKILNSTVLGFLDPAVAQGIGGSHSGWRIERSATSIVEVFLYGGAGVVHQPDHVALEVQNIVIIGCFIIGGLYHRVGAAIVVVDKL